MTHEEMERSINFLLDSQASLTANIEKLSEGQTRLTTSVESLTADVVEMKVQAELDRTMMRDAVSEMRNGIVEMQQGIAAMLLIAERMEQNVTGLTQAQKGTSQRVGRLEDRVTKLEQSDQPD